VPLTITSRTLISPSAPVERFGGVPRERYGTDRRATWLIVAHRSKTDTSPAARIAGSRITTADDEITSEQIRRYRSPSGGISPYVTSVR